MIVTHSVVAYLLIAVATPHIHNTVKAIFRATVPPASSSLGWLLWLVANLKLGGYLPEPIFSGRMYS